MLSEQLDTELNFSNIDELLSPISEEKPCGDYLRRHEFMINLKRIRSQLLASNEDLDVWVKKSKELPKWEDVVELSEEILTKYSKDLQVCAYYTESKLHTEGFCGLAKSLSFIVQICQRYWENVFPPIEEDNLELRISPFHWLQLNLPILIKAAPLSREIPPEAKYSVSWFWYENETSIGTNESLNARNFLLNSLEKENDDTILNLFGVFQSILTNLHTLENEYLSIFSQIDENEVTFSESISLCEEILSFINPIYTKRINIKTFSQEDIIQKDSIIENAASTPAFTENNNTKNLSYVGGELSSCEEAYHLITIANSFLLKNDPHSPSPYLVRRALEWRKKSLYGVLMELFTTTSKPQEIFTLLGLSHGDKGYEEN